MHHGLNLNIGIVIFVIIIIYVIFNLISYLTSSPVAEYEVGQGTIATNVQVLTETFPMLC